MAMSTLPWIPKDGVITIKDGAGTPLSLTVTYEEGDFSFDSIAADQKETTVFKDRGVTYAIRQTEEIDPTISFSAYATDLTDAADVTLFDVLRWGGAWSAATTTLVGGKAVDITFATTTTGTGGGTSSITFHGVVLKGGFSEGAPGKFSLTGTCYGNGAGTHYTVA
jgi:hypothetical protein